MKPNKQDLLPIIAAVYCGCLIVSNVIAGKTFALAGWQLPCAVVVFPLVYIANDVLTEIYGFRTARRVILAGFVVNVVAVAAYAAAVALPPSPFFASQEAYEAVFASTPRMLAASFLAYIVGSLANAKVMEAMKGKLPSLLMARCIGSTAVGETLDAAIFITVAFAWTMPATALLSMVALQAAFKTSYEIVVYPATRACIHVVRQLG